MKTIVCVGAFLLAVILTMNAGQMNLTLPTGSSRQQEMPAMETLGPEAETPGARGAFAPSLAAESQDAAQPALTDSLAITQVQIGSANTSEKYRMITFDIEWDYSWRTSSSPNNWDAAWVFMKYRVGGGEWRHAALSTVSAEHSSPPGSTISAPQDGKGVYLYRGEDGTGHFQAANVGLRWNYGQDHVADDAQVNVKVFGLEMVYIPEGSFYAGDNGASDASLIKGSNDRRSWFITSEDAIEVTNTLSNGYYYRSSKDVWNDVWNAHEDVTGAEFIIPADFPKGYRAIYCMKYEMTQQQYVNFLNTLTRTQAANRYDRANFQRYGYTIHEDSGVFSTTHPHRACGFISPADGFAFADWCGLRPMTELEFEKICRGSGNQPVGWEFAWGTTYSRNARWLINGEESDRLILTILGVNSYYSEDNYQPQFPLNAGIFAEPGKSRERSGAAFYGVLEMSTNLGELCVSIGNSYGRVFDHQNGDGQLAPDGYADENNWPLRNGQGGGFRGGCLAEERLHMCTSVRVEAALEIDHTHRHIPWGFRGVRTVSY